MQLEEMLAYKVTMLASDLSESLSKEYAAFQLTMPQWRIVATLGARHEKMRDPSITAKNIVTATRLDKVQVSRAIERLVKKDMVTKRASKSDKRAFLIRLTTQGEEVYNTILPRVVSWQNNRLKNITKDEYRIFLKVIHALTP
ncbi:MarR family winged helix-turn-helix transcriptional regulator [Alteromonas gracilis]|uniref:MarR family winged helix-turn-helix transcriptional regulator n=1 Tax=Alteromonas gracilis TaxID=1479524 RepID=UPI003735D5E8